jgi:hypothetical protein
LEENLINIERVKLAGTVAIDRLPNVGDKFSQLCVVVVRDHRARAARRSDLPDTSARLLRSPAPRRRDWSRYAVLTPAESRASRAVRHGKTFCVHREPPG